MNNYSPRPATHPRTLPEDITACKIPETLVSYALRTTGCPAPAKAVDVRNYPAIPAEIPALSSQSLRFEGTELFETLGITTKPIKLFLLKNLDKHGKETTPERNLDANSALYLVKRGCYGGFDSKTRIKRIVERDPRPTLPYVPGNMRERSCVIAFWPSQESPKA